MNLRINHHNGVPIFRQLQDQIKLAIASGVWKPGDSIPTTRQLSEQLKVNPMTISKAFSNLEIEGWLERRRGLPTIVSTQLSSDMIKSTRTDILRELLEPVAIQVQQMDLDTATAEQIWKQLLQTKNETNPHTH